MNLTSDQRRQIEDVLRDFGFGHAWQLANDDDETELIIFVQPDELAVNDEALVTRAVMQVMPWTKVLVDGYKPAVVDLSRTLY